MRYTIPIPTLQSIQRRWKATAQTANGQQCRKYYRTEHVDGVDLASFLHLYAQYSCSQQQHSQTVKSNSSTTCYSLVEISFLGDMFRVSPGSIS